MATSELTDEGSIKSAAEQTDRKVDSTPAERRVLYEGQIYCSTVSLLV